MKIFLPPALLEVTAEEPRATSNAWKNFNRERAQRTQKVPTIGNNSSNPWNRPATLQFREAGI